MFDLGTILAIELGLFGIAITIFTVLYTFVLNKKNELSIYTELKRKQKKNSKTILDQKIIFAEKYISSTKKINTHLLILVFYTFAISFISFFLIAIDCFFDKTILEVVNMTFSLLTLLSLIYVFVMLIIVANRYVSEVKIK